MVYFLKRLVTLCVFFVLSSLCFGQQSLNLELKTLQKKLVPDKRVAILDISLNDTLQPTLVKGETNLPDAKNAIIGLLAQHGFRVADSIRLLPDAAVGSKTWALANLSVSNLRALPDHASEMVTQVVMGTPLKVLDYKEKWYKVQTPEYYIGWMDSSGLATLTDNEIEQWRKSKRFHYNKFNGVAYSEPNAKSNVVTDLVIGNLFQAEHTVKGFLKIKLPDGRVGYVRKNECATFTDWCNTEANSQSVLKIAKQMMGAPYLWGGTSSKGVDCSGFVKMVYYSQGIILARDASQQARYGEVVDYSKPETLQPADLLFFGRSAQRITHVGMYIAKGDFIHSSGRVHISSLDPNDPKYVATRNFVAARRVLTSLNTEGIIKVKDHPWYK